MYILFTKVNKNETRKIIIEEQHLDSKFKSAAQ